MKQTPNYNLPQFEGADKFTKEDLNDAFSKIDIGISDIQDTINISNGDNMVITQEIVQARKGENSLGTKINNIDTQLSEIAYNVKTFGAKGDGVTNDDIAVQKADAKGGTLLFPPGRYILTSPPNSKSFGVGATLVVENGYEMALDSKPLEVNSIWQTYIRLNNTDLGVNAGKKLDNTNYGNVAIGNNALKDAETRVIKNIALGHNALGEGTWLYQNTVVGTDACAYTKLAERNTVVGSNAGLGMGDSIVVGRSHMFRPDVDTTYLDNIWSEWRTYAGTVNNPTYKPTDRSDVKGNTAIGRNSMGWTITPKNNVAVGYNSLEKAVNGENNVSIGESSLYNGIKVNNTISIGTKANQNNADSTGDVSIGYNAMQQVTHSQYNTVLGFQALSGFGMTDKTPKLADNVAIGRFSMANTQGAMSYNVGVGSSSLRYNQGNYNVGVGYQAGQDNTTGNNNTFIGNNAGKSLKTNSTVTAIGSNALNNVSIEGYSNITGIGQNSTVTGENQLQLGNSLTNPYAFNALQLRSDARDKIDIEDTELGLEFINKLRPVQYKQNFREAYIDYDEEGNVVEIKNDKSRAGKRKHQGLIAQEVKQVIDELGVDFAGYQNHSINGGKDVHSLGYEEFISPMIKSIQELSDKVKKLEEQLYNK